MCGIAGIFGGSNRVLVEEMLNDLRHRGPDDSYILSDANFTLGATRLSINDLAHGRQPLTNEVGDIIAAQNGEIYNYPALKRWLMDRGHMLVTGCDTEVLPHLYEERGVAMPAHLDGMFAVAIWDTTKQNGILIRDRIGKKPLYYTYRDSVLYFGSEIKTLLRVPSFTKRLNAAAVHHYLSLKHVPHPETVFDGIFQIPPAHALFFRPGGLPEIRRYWKPIYSSRAHVSKGEDELVDDFLQLLHEAVKRRLMADVPIGFFLSGGLDSSLTTALAAEMSKGEIRTFTLTYDSAAGHSGKDEDQKWAAYVAKKYRTQHHEEIIDYANFPERLRAILWHFDEPFSGVISTYFLSELMHQHVKVAISGDGADELFGSYLSHRLALPLANYPHYLETQDSSLVPGFESNLDLLMKVYAPEDWAWRGSLLTYAEAEKQNLYTEDFRERVGCTSTRAYLREAFADLSSQDPLNRVLEAEFNTIFPDQVLTFLDRLSMAHSLEVRCPYLDTAVVEFVASLSGDWKIRNGITKYLLKQAALRYFPREMVERKKEGFLMPISQWLSAELEPYVRETLDRDRIAPLNVFRPDAVQCLVNRLYATPNPHYSAVNQVYALVVFFEWADLFLDHH